MGPIGPNYGQVSFLRDCKSAVKSRRHVEKTMHGSLDQSYNTCSWEVAASFLTLDYHYIMRSWQWKLFEYVRQEFIGVWQLTKYFVLKNQICSGYIFRRSAAARTSFPPTPCCKQCATMSPTKTFSFSNKENQDPQKKFTASVVKQKFTASAMKQSAKPLQGWVSPRKSLCPIWGVPWWAIVLSYILIAFF